MSDVTMPWEVADEQVWVQRSAELVGALPASLRRPGPLLTTLDYGLRKKEAWGAESARRRALADVIQGMGEEDVGALLRAMFPNVERAARHAWDTIGRRSVRTEEWQSERPFRGSQDPRLLARARAMWVDEIAEHVLPRTLNGVEMVQAACAHFGKSDALGWLATAILDGYGPGGEADARAGLRVLEECAMGRDPELEPDGSVYGILLGSAWPEAWAVAEKMLMAAKREEGLRQAILEGAAAGHPEAFRRILKLVVDENLVRFSSVVRAVDVWFGLAWDSASGRHVQKQVELVLSYLEDRGAREAAIAGKDGNEAYLALWATAFEDLPSAERAVEASFEAAPADVRFAGVYLLARTCQPHLAPLMERALADGDARVGAAAARYFATVDAEEIDRGRAFSALLGLVERMGGRKTLKLKPIVWPWTEGMLTRAQVGSALLSVATAQDAGRLAEHVAGLGAWDRQRAAELLHALLESDPADERARAMLVTMMGDPAQGVREAAFEGMRGRPVGADEAARLESLLERKAADLRTGALGRLAEQADAEAVASVGRLVRDGKAERRSAGVELAQTLARAGRAVGDIAAALKGVDPKKGFSAVERAALAELAAGKVAGGAGGRGGAQPTLGNCLGLLEGLTPTPAREMVDRGYMVATPAAVGVVLSLDALIEKNKNLPLKHPRGNGDWILGTASQWTMEITEPEAGESSEETEDGEGEAGADRGEESGSSRRSGIVLEELWRGWDAERGAELRDRDGLELVRALCVLETLTEMDGDGPRRWPRGYQGLAAKNELRAVRYGSQIHAVLKWFARWMEPSAWLGTVLDSMETAVARGNVERWPDSDEETGAELTTAEIERPFDWYDERLHDLLGYRRAHHAPMRFWELYRGLDVWGERVWSPKRLAWLASDRGKKPQRWYGAGSVGSDTIPRADVGVVIAAAKAGVANEADLIRHMLHMHPGEKWHDRGLYELTHPVRLAKLDPPEWVPAVVQRVIERVIDIELDRGDSVTEATPVAKAIAVPGGAEVALRALSRLGSLKLARSGFNWADNKAGVLSRVIIKSRVGAGDTPEVFAEIAERYGVGEDRLLELALYAPQWAGHVGAVLGWEGFTDGVWWVHAHTKDNGWRLDEEAEAARNAAIAERTPIPADELTDGAVDTAWFHRVYAALGKARWERVYEAAKYACGGIGHKRAQLFADAMLGLSPEKDLVERIEKKRHQDSVRALGLLPLKGSKGGQVLARYKVMQELRRTSRKHGGSMLQASEKRAVEIGMENLARTAGYPDPVRLQWAMEAESVADLAKGPVTAKAGDVTVTLMIDEEGSARIGAEKKGKALASVPAAARKDAKVAELTERLKEIKRQASRMRESLEGAMCRGDVFRGGELAELFKHPVLRPMLERLVFVGDGVAGYPEKGGKVLRSHDGTVEAIKASEEVRIAHPHDLLKSKAWAKWQRECFAAERVQPFKQVFRELYLPTAAEKGAQQSTRYAGQQVYPRQAVALLGKRGWVNRPEEGVQRTFHAERITVGLEFEEHFYTPAEVEGLTVEAVAFWGAGGGRTGSGMGSARPLKLGDVPARVFSEVMRDIDLAVSVAHRGGVDPEASESTVEARTSLLRETCRLLKLGNVKIEGNRANIAGELGDYSVHLGSATVHMLPGGTIWIVPVHAQHRGRLFLPFADNDPKTAEVISKVLLLARDGEIKDPAIREQIARYR